MADPNIYDFDEEQDEILQAATPNASKRQPARGIKSSRTKVPRRKVKLDAYLAAKDDSDQETVKEGIKGTTEPRISGEIEQATKHVPASPALTRKRKRESSGVAANPAIRTEPESPFVDSVSNDKSQSNQSVAFLSYPPRSLEVEEDSQSTTRTLATVQRALADDEDVTDDIISTPRIRKPSRKALVGISSRKPNEESLPDSPSKNASIRRARARDSPAQHQSQAVPSDEKQAANADDILQKPMPASPAVYPSTPTKLKNIQLIETPRQTPQSRLKSHIAKSSPRKTVQVVPDLAVDEKDIARMKHHVIGKLGGKCRLPLMHRDKQYIDVHTLLRETIQRAESNSALILGPQSSGKSTLIEQALQSFKDAGEEFLIVRLDGAVQTDDKMALRTIARQLQPENDEIANADIMTALIAILAHPAEFGESSEPLSTILILDNFDLFCEHPRQTLLYNLFDIAQSKKAPICVLGLTRKVDAFDRLEKRVKSRFSHRIIQVPAPKYSQFCEVAFAALQHTGEAGNESFVEYATAWNQVLSESADLEDLMKLTFLTSGNIKELFATVLPMVAQVRPTVTSSPFLNEMLAEARYKTLQMQGKVELLQSLSLLDLSLLIAACRLELRSAPISFSTAFDEYKTLANKLTISQRITGVTNSRIFSKELCYGSWQRLIRQTLLIKSSGGTAVKKSSSAATDIRGGEFGVVKCEAALWQIKELIKDGTIKIPNGLNAWLTL